MVAAAVMCGASGLRAQDTGPDSAGPVGVSTVTIGGEQFAVDPRGGTLNYAFEFLKGNVNYGQTPFSLSLAYQQNAVASYVGAFTDSDDHSHPYGVSAYLPTPLPKATEPAYFNGSTDQLDDAGGTWDLNLPAIFMSTSRLSKYYGKNKIAVTVVLDNTSYQYVISMPNVAKDAAPGTYQAAYTSAFTNNTTATPIPLYAKDAQLLTISGPPDGQSIQIQDRNGINYLFAPAVLYGYQGINVYNPDYNSSNNANGDQVLVYRIKSITYPTGLSLNFAYTDDFQRNTEHTVTVTDTVGNVIATVTENNTNLTVSVANQQGRLQSLYSASFTGADFRIGKIANLSNSRQISYGYQVNQKVPYGWNNQTTLYTISNSYTNTSVALSYAQQNANVYDAGCTKFLLGQIAVSQVTTSRSSPGSGTATPISRADYEYGFTTEANTPTFMIPMASGSKSYGAGVSHWLENLFYQNQDSSGCSHGDLPNTASLTYQTTVATSFPDANRNRLERLVYDAFGRTVTDFIQPNNGPGAGKNSIQTSYGYGITPAAALAYPYGSFDTLPMWYGSPSQMTNAANVCTLNGTVLNSQGSCYPNLTQQWSYDGAGNPTREISPLGQETDYTYLPASQTAPPNERLAASITTHAIGNNGASYVVEAQDFQTLAVAPAGGGANATTTLPIGNVETRFDAGSSAAPYAYRSDTMGNYVTGDTANPVLNGILGQRVQTDTTGISDVQSLTTAYSPGFVANFDNQGQSALVLQTSLSGQTNTGQTASRNRGGAAVNFMGYPLQGTDGLGRAVQQSYDNYGRLASETIMAGTAYAQTSAITYDDTPGAASNLSLNDNASFAVTRTDGYGNQTIDLYDCRKRLIATYRTLTGGAQVETNAYVYDPVKDLLTSETVYGNGYTRTRAYYYGPGTNLRVATVPNAGLAEGRIIDGVNGNTLTFTYQPAASGPTVIGKIYGPVSITHIDIMSQLVLATGKIDADAATAALGGFDLVDSATGAVLNNATGNIWLSPLNLLPAPLANLYTAISRDPVPALTTADNLLEVTTFTYDEWNRQSSATQTTFVDGQGVLSKATTSIAYDTAHRATTVTYPQGQQKTTVTNLPGAVQSATLTIGGAATAVGSFVHDGLGRVVQYVDTMNGSSSTKTYAATTGVQIASQDALGNSKAYAYDPVSYRLIGTTTTPPGGSAITVSNSYDTHLRLTGVSDTLGNVYARSYAPSGLISGSTVLLQGTSATYAYGFTYDNYGDLTGVVDPFLPVSLVSPGVCQMTTPSWLKAGTAPPYTIVRDSYGRLSLVSAPAYHGISRSFSYDPVTGLPSGDTIADLPAVATCGQNGSLTVTTALGFDDNLRLNSKTISGAGLPAAAQFNQSYDQAGHVVWAARTDAGGGGLNESFTYDPTTRALTGWTASEGPSGTYAAPHEYYTGPTPTGLAMNDGAIYGATYGYDLYGNLTQTQETGEHQGSSGPVVVNRRMTYGNPANPFQVTALAEQHVGAMPGARQPPPLPPSSEPYNFTIEGSYSYDRAGNVISDGYGRGFGYDANGLLTTITRADEASESLIRDGNGRIVQRQASWLGGPVTEYGRARLQNGNWQVAFFAGTAAFSTPDALVDEGTSFLATTDGIGRAISNLAYGQNSAGLQILGSTSYLPHGTATNRTSPDAGYPAGIASTAVYPDAAFGTASGADVGTGLHIMGGYRAYDPLIGRFLQRDSMSPFGKGGLNPYAYAANDPINLIDPTGHAASANDRIYGPKPPHAHHHSDGGSFWDGFKSGFVHSAKEIYEQPYHWGKGLYHEAATGSAAGFFKDLGETAGEIALTMEVGEEEQMALGPVGSLAFSEFVSFNASSVMGGKTPFSAHVPAGKPYDVGYSMGGAAAQGAEAVAAAALFYVGGEALDAAATPSSIADASSADAQAVSSTNINPAEGHAPDPNAEPTSPAGSARSSMVSSTGTPQPGFDQQQTLLGASGLDGEAGMVGYPDSAEMVSHNDAGGMQEAAGEAPGVAGEAAEGGQPGMEEEAQSPEQAPAEQQAGQSQPSGAAAAKARPPLPRWYQVTRGAWDVFDNIDRSHTVYDQNKRVEEEPLIP